jgi:hypothetical protein
MIILSFITITLSCYNDNFTILSFRILLQITVLAMLRKPGWNSSRHRWLPVSKSKKAPPRPIRMGIILSISYSVPGIQRKTLCSYLGNLRKLEFVYELLEVVSVLGPAGGREDGGRIPHGDQRTPGGGGDGGDRQFFGRP